MSTIETSEKPSIKLVTLNKASKLAEQWVRNMTGSWEDEPKKVELEARPPRLGLGAKPLPQHRVGLSSNPVERKLQAKLDAVKRKATQRAEEEAKPASREGCGDDDTEEDENSESRTKAFAKKKALPLTSPSQAKKKKT